MDVAVILIRAAAVALIAVGTSCATATQSTSFAVLSVSAGASDCLNVESRQLPFSCHRLVHSKNNVIGIREFTPSRMEDGSRFSKITVSLPEKIVSGQEFVLPSDEASLFFSSGASSFAGKTGCYGYADSGVISILSVDMDYVEVSIDASVNTRSPLNWPGDCGRENIHRTFRADWVGYDSLGAWEGRPSASDTPFDEAHPRRMGQTTMGKRD